MVGGGLLNRTTEKQVKMSSGRNGAGDVTRRVSVNLSCLIPLFTSHTRYFVSCNLKKNSTERDF